MSKKALKKSFFGSLTRLLGVLFASTAGYMLPKDVLLSGYAMAGTFAFIAFLLMWLSEFHREKTE